MAIDYRNNSDIIWTTNEYNIGEVSQYLPYIYLRSYQVKWSALINKIAQWISPEAFAERSEGNAYANLYQGTFQQDYYLPYFTDMHHQISQTWQENPGKLPLPDMLKKGTSLIETVAKSIYPTGAILSPKAYTGSTPQEFFTKFYLINTKTSDGYKSNKKFLKTIINENLHINGPRTAGFLITPPVIYEALIPGIRFCPVCYVNSLNVVNVGSINMINGLAVPDAWEITISFVEMTNEDRNSFADSDKTSVSGVTTRVFEGPANTNQPSVPVQAPTPAPPSNAPFDSMGILAETT